MLPSWSLPRCRAVWRDGIRICALDQAAALDVVEIAAQNRTLIDRPPCAAAQEVVVVAV